MKLTAEDIGQWIVPGIVSVAIHAGILALFLGTRGCGSTPAPAAGASAAAPAVAQNARAESPETARTEDEKPREEAKPRTTPPPKAKKNGKSGSTAKPKPAETKPKISDAKPKNPDEVPTPSEDNLYVYTVKKGDNFTHIARDHGVAPEELARLNGKELKAFASVQVGQKIKAPKKAD